MVCAAERKSFAPRRVMDCLVRRVTHAPFVVLQKAYIGFTKLYLAL